MAQATLNVSLREGVGKGGARAVRRQDLIPAVVYGKGMEPCPITVAPKELDQVISGDAGWNTLITLAGDGPFSGKVVILKDLEIDPIRRDMLHADFHAIDLQKKIFVMVPVHPVGKAAGEKVGGYLQVIRHELEVACLPGAIPDTFEVDVTPMEIGDVFHVEDLELPAGVEVPHEVNFTVLTVTGRKSEEEEAAAEEAAEEV